MNYQVGGALAGNAPSYVTRPADDELYAALDRSEFCYVLNSRQMGKSSLLVRMRTRLQQAGARCTTLDMSVIGNENITPAQWYNGLLGSLWSDFNLSRSRPLKPWLQHHAHLALVQKLDRFLAELLFTQFPQDKIVIFIDEIDSILNLNFSVDDFFALIRDCYSRRSVQPDYQRLTFAIFGVATAADLIQDGDRTLFAAGRAIDLQPFRREDASPLAAGLAADPEAAQAMLSEILSWTAGQPFLTQKLCQLVAQQLKSSRSRPSATGQPAPIAPAAASFQGHCSEEVAVSNAVDALSGGNAGADRRAVQRLIGRYIANWESYDEPEHLRTIQNRLLRDQPQAERILEIYQQIVQGEAVPVDQSREQSSLLLSGLVVKQQGYLQVKNRIYQEIFNAAWLKQQLSNLPLLNHPGSGHGTSGMPQ